VTLQELCAARGLRLAQRAERAGGTLSVVTKIDAGTLRPQPVTRHRLTAVLGLEPEALRLELSAARRRGGRSPGLGSGLARGQFQVH
jgi:hypothetical protein